jgi:urease accessory protein
MTTTTHVHQDGLLDLRFARASSGRTFLAGCRQRFPLRVTLPHYLDEGDRGMAFLIIQNPAGAVFAGDHLELRLEAERDARVHLRTQSATRLCQMEGERATQTMAVQIAAGAYVEYLPEILIPQAGSSYLQRLSVEAEHGASLVTAEIIAPGRRAYGERFGYEQLRLETAVSIDGRELAVDVLDLCPGRRHPDRAGMLGANDYLASVLVVCPGGDAERLAGAIDAALAGTPGISGAAGLLPDAIGIVGRVLAPTASAARAGVRTVWASARLQLLGLALPSRLD